MEADWVRKGGVPSASRWAAGAMWALALMLPLSLFGSSPPAATPMLMLLSVLALVAELVGRHGTRRLALPLFVVAWWSFGPLAAWLVDIAALGACAIGARSKRDSGTLAPRVFRATIASVAASLLAGPVRTSLVNQDIASVAAPLTFAVLYLVADAAIGHFTREGNATFWALPLVLLPVVGVAGVVLAESGVPAAAPLLLGPIVALHLLENASARLNLAHENTVQTLAAMLQRAHPYTHRHLERVAETAERVAIRLGLGRVRAHDVRQAALLHDIGKIAIDEQILDAPRKLTKEEFDHVKLHAAYGGEILAEIDAMRETARWIRHHHERPDGTGYPLGLLDPEIPLESKIIAVVDAYDAMTGGMEGKDGRPFRQPMTQDEALAELERCSGSQFDAAVVAAFRQEVEGCTR